MLWSIDSSDIQIINMNVEGDGEQVLELFRRPGPLAIISILKGSVCTVTDEDWLQHRRLKLYHRSMDHIIRDINELCPRGIYIRFCR